MMNWLRRIFAKRASPPTSTVPVLYVHMPGGSSLSEEYVPEAGKILPGVHVRVVHDDQRKYWHGVAFAAHGFDLQEETYRELTAALKWSFPAEELR